MSSLLVTETLEKNLPENNKMILSKTSATQSISEFVKIINMENKECESKIFIDQPTGIPNCKRCGVIFVDIKTNYTSQKKYFNSRVTKVHSFLVVKGRISDIWSLPKGRTINENEDENVCAERELYEETGIKLDTKNLPKIVIGKNVYFVKHVQQKDYQTFNIQDHYEVSEVAWKSVSELRTMTCNKDLRAVLGFPRQQNPTFYNIVYKTQRDNYTDNKDFFNIKRDDYWNLKESKNRIIE